VTPDEVLSALRALADPSRLPGMARYGIATAHALGVTVGELRTVAREIGRDHALAAQLWDSGVHEARILASLLDDPALVDDAQFERWALGFDSWDLCDQVCQNLFRYAAPAWTKAGEWTTRPELFVRRAGYSLMAGLAAAEQLREGSRAARWVGTDAVRELGSPAVRKRLGRTAPPTSGA
jgi:3-methyladenine DNA glycosylase AlkD